MTRPTRCHSLLPGVVLVALGLFAPTARAQTSYTWNRDADDDWSIATNWLPNGIPNAQGDAVTFGGVITANRTVALNSNVTVGSISFENTGLFSYTIGGTGIITLDNGASPASISVASTSLSGQTITRHLIAAGDVNITNDSLSGLLTLSGGMSLGANTLTVNGPGAVYFSNNPITGTAGSRFILNGPGVAYLGAANTGLKYEVNGGTLIAFTNNALQPLQAGTLTPDLITLANGGAINFHVEQTQRDYIGITLGTGGGRIDTDATGPVSLSAPITGGGSLTKVGTGTIALSALNTYTGDTLIRQGTLRIDANAPSGAAGALGNASSAVMLGDNLGGNSTALYIGVNGVTVGRDIIVEASPTPGVSTVTLGVRPADVFSAVNGSFTGTLTLNRPVTLTVLASGAGSGVSFGRITGTGGITIAGVAPITFTSTASDFTGTINLDSGTLSMNSDAQLGAPTNDILMRTGRLLVTGSTPFSTSRPITLVTSGTSGSKIDVQNTDAASGFTINSAITGTGPLIKRGPGILTFAGANTYGTTTYIEAGTLSAAGPFVFSPNSTIGVYAPATVKLNGFSQQVARIMDGSPSSFGTIDLGSNPATVLTVGQNNISKSAIQFQGQIVGLGDLVFTGIGSQWMGGTSSYLGTTTVRQGILELRAAVPAASNGPLGDPAGGAIRLGDASFADLNAVITSADKSASGFARPITVVAGAGKRLIGHRLFGSTHATSTVTFSGPIALEKDLHLYSIGDRVDGSANLRIDGVLSGTAGLVKIGGGQTFLRADNTYTGATTINNGRLVLGGLFVTGSAASSSGFIVRTDWSDPGPGLDTAVNPPPGDRSLAEFLIQDFAANPNRIGNVDVTLAQGRFGYFGQDGVSSESFANLVIDLSANELELLTPASANTTSATLSMTGGLLRNNNATLHVISTELGDPNGGDFTRVLVTTPPALSGGGGAAGSTNISILPWAYHSTGPDGLSTIRNLLTYGSTGLRPLAVSEYASSLTAPGDLNNVRLTTAAPTLAQDQTINALFFDRAVDDTITLTGQTLTVASGAILSTSAHLTFAGGELAFGAAEGIIHSTDYSSVTINSVISGSGGLTSHLGFGSTLALNGANTYTGPTTINSGNVAFNSAASFGSASAPIRLRWGWPGGTMTYSGAGATTLANPIEIGPATNLLHIGNGGTLTLSGEISGTGLDPLNHALSFSTGSGGGIFELRAVNTFTGRVRVLSGIVGIIHDNNLGAAANSLTLGGTTTNTPTLRFDAADLTVSRPMVFDGHATIDTNGHNATIAGAITGGSYTTNFTKAGAGVLTLTGTNTYNLTTQVSAGTLRVDGSLEFGFSSGLVHVNNGGTLGGSGTIGRLVRMHSGGTLAPGAGPGTLTLAALEFTASASSNYEWEAGASVQDQIVVTEGPVDLTDISVTLNLYDRGLGTAITPNQQFPLLTVAGANSITGFTPANFTVVFEDSPLWSTSQYSLNVVQISGNSVLVLSNISPVPEPAGLLAVAGVALGIAAWRRRGFAATKRS